MVPRKSKVSKKGELPDETSEINNIIEVRIQKNDVIESYQKCNDHAEMSDNIKMSLKKISVTKSEKKCKYAAEIKSKVDTEIKCTCCLECRSLYVGSRRMKRPRRKLAPRCLNFEIN